MAVYVSGKALPGTQRRGRTARAKKHTREMRRLWRQAERKYRGEYSPFYGMRRVKQQRRAMEEGTGA